MSLCTMILQSDLFGSVFSFHDMYSAHIHLFKGTIEPESAKTYRISYLPWILMMCLNEIKKKRYNNNTNDSLWMYEMNCSHVARCHCFDIWAFHACNWQRIWVVFVFFFFQIFDACFSMLCGLSMARSFWN